MSEVWPPLLLPMPRVIERAHGSAPASLLASPDVVVDGAVAAGGYRIEVTASRVVVSHRDPGGLWASRATMSQLASVFPERVPCLRVDDSPAFATRGFMLDVSRDRVPTMDHLRAVVDVLAALKFNHLQLYTEHTFAYAGHETVWRDASPITPDELRSIDAYASERGVELAANQNCFGHLGSWLRHSAYAHLAETHGEYDFYGIRRDGPFSLCPLDPGSIGLVRDLLGQLGPCVRSELLNINCDETADVGAGRSADAVRVHGKASVYGRFVAGVCREAMAIGKRPMFWADIALSSPEVFEWLPDELLAVAWGYEPDSPFAEWSRTLAGREHWVAPGTSAWRSFVGRTSERRENLSRAAREGLSGGATGYLVTEWGDIGHRQTWPITLRAIADAASCAWTGGDLPSAEAADRFAFGAAGSGLSGWLDELGDADEALRAIGGVDAPGGTGRLKNASALFEELHPARRRALPIGTLGMWEMVRDRLESLAAARPAVADELLGREAGHAVSCARLGADVAVARRAGESVGADRLAQISREHAALWPARARPGGLRESLSHWSGIELGAFSR